VRFQRIQDCSEIRTEATPQDYAIRSSLVVAIAALIVIIIIIPLRACQSAEYECHHGQKRRKFDLSRHDFGPSDPVLIFSYGILFFDRLFHATGHALHYSMIDEPSFLLRANYAEPFDEGLAQIMALMLYRPEVDIELFGLTPEQARLVAETHRLRELYDLRNTMADSLFEFEAYADPDQDLAGLYNRIHSKYLPTRPEAYTAVC
jgi:hypothetical protein